MDGWKPLDYEKRVFLGHVCKKNLSIRRKRVFLEHVYKKIVLRKSMKKSDFGKRVFLEHVCTKQKFNDKTMHISRDQNKNEHCVKKTSNIMQAKKRGFVMFVWANASRPAIQRFKTPTSGFQISRRFVNYNWAFFRIKNHLFQTGGIWSTQVRLRPDNLASKTSVFLEHVSKICIVDKLETRNSRTRMQKTCFGHTENA